MLEEKTKGAVLRSSVLVLLTLQTSIAVLCLRYSRMPTNSEVSERTNESPMYFPSSLIICAEIFKFTIVIVLVMVVQAKCSPTRTFRLLKDVCLTEPEKTLKFALPASLYTIQNYLVIYALTYLDAATYQTTFQARILTTAFFSSIMLGKRISTTQWVALVLLMMGVILIQVRPEKLLLVENSNPVQLQRFWGMGAVLGAAVISGYAGVYSEKLLKDTRIFSLLFAFVTPLTSDLQELRSKGFLYGFTPLVWMISFLQATGGLLVAASMKYADNIIKNFATSASIAMSTACSFFLFHDIPLKSSFFLGTAAVLISTFMYSWQKRPLNVCQVQAKCDPAVVQSTV